MSITMALHRLNGEIGKKTLFHADKDTHLLMLCRFLRMVAYGAAALILGIFLYTNGVKGQQIGYFMTLSLLGDAGISFLLTMMADKIGRRRVLLVGSVSMCATGVVFALSKQYWLLLLAAIVGVLTPGAHEVGPFRAVEESILAQLSPIEARTDIYAWYAVLSTFGMAIGLAAAGWITYAVRTIWSVEWSDAFPHVFWLYAIVGASKAALTLCLSEACEAESVPIEPVGEQATTPLIGQHRSSSMTKAAVEMVERVSRPVKTKVSKESKAILIRLCVLFAVDAFASGMLPVTLMSMYTNWRVRWYVHRHLGNLMALVWFVSSVCNLFSAPIARRIGLVRAMVFTHLPGAVFLGLIPLARNWFLVALLLIFRAAFNSMDQAPRSAFVAAVFLPEERTAVMGTINLVKTLGQAGGPLMTGLLMQRKMWWASFVTAASLKVIYNLGLLFMFKNTMLAEHGRRPRQTTFSDAEVGILLDEASLPSPTAFERFDGYDEDNEVDGFEGSGRNYPGGKADCQDMTTGVV